MTRGIDIRPGYHRDERHSPLRRYLHTVAHARFDTMTMADSLGAIQMGAALIALAVFLFQLSAGDLFGGISLASVSVSFMVVAALAALITLIVSPSGATDR